MQNSWGPSNGYEGFYFIHTDLECDGGVISAGRAIIPLFDKVDTTASDGVIQSYLFVFALANMALFVFAMFA